MYSWDEGDTWEEYVFSEQSHEIFNIQNDFETLTTNFFVYGVDSGNKAFILGMDFGSLH